MWKIQIPLLLLMLSGVMSFRIRQLIPTRVIQGGVKGLYCRSFGEEKGQKICIVGGGFGGLYTALAIDKKLKNSEIYLIDPKERFVFLPLLYELSVGSATASEVSPKYKDLLGNTNIKFIQGKVKDISFQDKSCSVVSADKTEQPLTFDQMVIAVGIQPRLDLIPGVKEHSLPFYRLEDSIALKKKLAVLKKSKLPFVRVAVIGGGFSGIEVAANIAQSLGVDRTIVAIVDRNQKILQTSSDYNRGIAERTLSTYGVSIITNTSVTNVTAEGLNLMDGNGEPFTYKADLVVTTSGTEQSEFVKALDVTKDRFGRILTDSTLQSRDYPFVYALGDCSGIDGELLPSTAQVAMQQSGVVAKNVVSTVKGSDKPLSKFNYIPLGEMLTLGVTEGALSSLGGYVQLNGPLASLARRVVYAVRMPTKTQSIKALLQAGAVTTGKVLSRTFEDRLI